MTVVHYSSNNSGGYWWLSAQEWAALEAAGWKITRRCPFDGAPTDATREGVTLSQALAEWVAVTGQDPYAEGCPWWTRHALVATRHIGLFAGWRWNREFFRHVPSTGTGIRTEP